jgi:hypothetical protein
MPTSGTEEDPPHGPGAEAPKTHNKLETLDSAPDTEASNTYDRIPLLLLATRTAVRDTMKQHPDASYRSSAPKHGIQTPSFETSVYWSTPKCRPPKDRVPTPGTNHRHRSAEGQRQASWHLR